MNTTVRSFRVVAISMLVALLMAACGQTSTSTGSTSATTAAGGTSATMAPATEATSMATSMAGEEATSMATSMAGEEATSMAGEEATSAAGTSATSAAGAASEPGTVRVGSKNFTEMYIMGELYAQLLENAGFTVERKFDLGATPIAQEAITGGDIDLYPEYTSTGLLEVLKQSPIADREELISALRSEYESQFQLTWLDPSEFNNTNTFAVTQATADQYQLATYSDLFAKAADLRLGGPPEFPEREDTKNLETVYGAQISSFKEYKQLGTGALRYDALQSGEVEAIVAFGTDGRIRADELVILEDDKQAYPTYSVAPVIRQDVLEQFPQIADELNQLGPLLTDEAMQNMNYAVDGPDAREPADVAKEFLEQNNLLQ